MTRSRGWDLEASPQLFYMVGMVYNQHVYFFKQLYLKR